MIATSNTMLSLHAKTRVLVVDDHPILRHGIAQLINRESDLIVDIEAENAEQALREIKTDAVDLAIVDLSLDGLSGLEFIKTLRTKHPTIRCLVLSMHDELLFAERALRAGARGYMMKQEATKKIISALRQIRDGQIYLSDAMHNRLLERYTEQPAPLASPLAALTDREMEVFRLIGKGLKTGEIALTIKRSVNTVEAHRAAIKRKLNLKNAAELARIAYQDAESR